MSNRLIIAIALLALSASQSRAQEIITDSLEFDKALATSPATLVQGQVSGVRVSPVDGNINGAINTLIRGVNSLRTDSQPLWIIDGVIVNASLNSNKEAFWQYGEESYTSPLNALSYLNPYDIESIEVLKNVSATTIYGSRGANGVILVNTKLPKKEGFHIDWNSNLGFNFSSKKLDGLTTGVCHNHSVNLSEVKGNTRFSLSMFYRKNEGVIKTNNNHAGGLRALFDTKANSVLWFGMNTAVAFGDMSSVAGTSYFGQPSFTMTLRNPSFFPGDSVEGWRDDYDDEAKDKRVTSSIYVLLNFTKSLSFKASFGLDFHNHNRYIWYGKGTSFGAENNGAASVLESSDLKYNTQALLSYKRYIGNHHIKAEAAFEFLGDYTKYNTQNGIDFYSHSLRARGLSNAASRFQHHKFDHDYNTLGGFVSLTYDWKNIFGIDFSDRLDNTPKYDDKAVVNYLSANAWVKLFGVRLFAGYGQAGREQYVPYGMYNQFISGDYPYRDSSIEMFFEGLNRLRSSEFNVGVDLSVLSDRLKFKFAYYDKTSDDTFTSWCFGKHGEVFWDYAPRTFDFKMNSRIANRGFEADLSAIAISATNFKWTINANAAYNVNQMLEVDVNDGRGKYVGQGMLVNANVVGYPVGMLFGYKTNEDGSFKDLTGDKKINEYDKDCIGNPNPKITGALGTTFNAGPFVVDILANGAAGFDILNLNDLLYSGTTDVSDRYIEKGDYLRLSRVSVGYKLLLPKVKFIKSIDFKLSAFNLATLTSYSGWNPETNCFGTTYLSSGVDYGSYPAMRSVVFGVNVKF